MIIVINVSWAPNQHIRMISEGSCDTEDWSNDAENSALHHRNKLHLTLYYTIENSCFKLQSFFTILLYLLHFWSNTCSLDEHKKRFEKHLKILQMTNFWIVLYAIMVKKNSLEQGWANSALPAHFPSLAPTLIKHTWTS